MKIPDIIRICGVDYNVVIKDTVTNNSRVCYGKIDFDNSFIELSNTDGAEHQRRCITFLHEIIHGIINAMHSGDDIENEEYICKLLAKGLYQVLQDNGRKLFDIVDTESEVCQLNNLHIEGEENE